jgi:hypothetical protein
VDNSRLPVDNCGCRVHKVATRALEDITGGLSLWINLWISLRGHLSVSCILSVLPSVRTRLILSVRLLLPKSTQIKSYFHVTP